MNRADLEPSLAERDVHADHEVRARVHRDGEPLLETLVEAVAHCSAVVPRASIVDVDGADDATRRTVLVDRRGSA